MENLNIPFDRALRVVLVTSIGMFEKRPLDELPLDLIGSIPNCMWENINFFGLFRTILSNWENWITPLDRAHLVVVVIRMQRLEGGFLTKRV